MEYKIYDRKSFPVQRTPRKRPVVTFSPSDGRVMLNYAASHLVGVECGDAVEIIQDRECPSRIGIRKAEGTHGFELRPRHDNALCFISKALVQAIIPAFGRRSTTRVQLGTEKSDGAYWLLNSSVGMV